MKNLFFPILAVLILLTACKKDIKTADTVTPDNDASVNQLTDTEVLLKKYEKEGFIDKNTYVVVLIKPAGSRFNQLDIENQAKKRAFVSLQNEVISENKRLSANDKTVIVNSINNNGKLKKIKDEKQSRDIYVFEICEENFYNKIKKMGI
ncbi:MAG: hypothetical protein JW982_12050 [Spirochaetes bacterium]|nr:hypothetical protein [Spirochaetota bacterium]